MHGIAHDSSERRSGLMGGGGVGFTLGTRQTETTADIAETTHTGSLIGSLEGRVDIAAGGDVTITGSEVISQDGIGISGQNVTIQAAENTTAITETQRFRQSGLNVSLTGGAVSTAMAVAGSVQRAGEVQDDRLAALHVARAGQTLFSGGGAGMDSLGNLGNQASQGIADARNGTSSGSSGLSLRIGIGASSSDSRMDYSATTSSGSRIASAGDVVIHATGDGAGNGGDVTITGSRVEGDNVTLAAARDLLLQSQRETSEQVERNQASSGEIGVTIGSEAGIGVYVSASGARGRGDGSGTTHAETTVDAANTLTLISGRDTTLEGAQAKGETVIADIGGNLTLTSQQDTSEYERRDQSAGIDVAVGFGGGSVSGNYSQSSIDSTYTSVREQTGIQAGDGGFDIVVGGHTQLTGAAIASTADPSRNRLSTGSLSATDLENRAAYEAESFSISGGTSGGGGNPWSGGVSPGLGVSQDESIGSTTRSGISAGTIEIRDGDESALANLDRSVTELQQDGLRDIFDLQRVQERMEMGQVAGEVGFQAAGDLAGRMGWEEGSPERAALHGLVGAGMAALGGGNALQGATGAAASQLATNAMQDYLRDNDIDPNSPEGRSLMELGSLAVGAAIGGSSGAATALHGEQFNRQLHPDEINLIGELAEEFARALCGCDEVTLAQIQEAQARLMREAAAQVDAVANVHFGTDVDEAAQFFLQSNRQSYGWGTAFHADDAEYNNRGVFSNELSADVAAFTQMYNAIARSGVDVDTLRYMHQPQLLAWADNEVARDSRILLFGQGATALAGAGLVLAPTVLGTLTTQSAINAGRVQAVNNVPTLTASAMATSAGTGAAVGGLFYTGPIAADAAWQLTWNGTPFFETFSPQFSSDKFVGSLAIGAVGGFAVNTALFNMGLPTRLIPSLQTVEGQVLRTNAVVGSVGGNQAWRAYVDHRDGQNNQPSPNAQQESSQHDTTEDGP